MGKALSFASQAKVSQGLWKFWRCDNRLFMRRIFMFVGIGSFTAGILLWSYAAASIGFQSWVWKPHWKHRQVPLAKSLLSWQWFVWKNKLLFRRTIEVKCSQSGLGKVSRLCQRRVHLCCYGQFESNWRVRKYRLGKVAQELELHSESWSSGRFCMFLT